MTGFITRITKLKESDAIVDIFSKENGNESFYLRNLFSAKSKRKSSVQLLNLIDFNLYKQKNKQFLPIIQEIKLISEFELLKNPLSYFSECFLIAEILNKFLMKDVANPDLYQILEQASKVQISASTTDNISKQFSSFFIIRLLKSLGFIADLKICHNTGKKLDLNQGIIPLSQEAGFIQLENEAPNENINKIVKIFSFWENSQSLADFNRITIPNTLLTEILNILLDWVEGTLMNKLKSRQLVINS